MSTPLDENRIPVMQAVSNVDASIVPVQANPVTNALKVSDISVINSVTDLVISKEVSPSQTDGIYGSGNYNFIVKAYSYKTINTVKYYSTPATSNSLIVDDGASVYVNANFTKATGVDGYYITWSYKDGSLETDTGITFTRNDYLEGGDIGDVNTYQIDSSTIVAFTTNPTFTPLPSGTDFGITNAVRNENRKVAFMAVSAADGVTPVPVYADVDGNLLITTI